MKATIVVFPGSNCDRDTAVAIRAVCGQPPNLVWHRDSELPASDLIVLPGGFSYGDYLRAGAIAARSPIMAEVARRAAAGTPVVGICNGFQILLETGLLPGVLSRNANLRFAARDVFVRVVSTDSVFTGAYRRGQVLRLPVAHMDGNYQAAPEDLKAVEDNGQVAFRYTPSPDGSHEPHNEHNPNGSSHDIAGIFNRNRNVLGLMPHPERAIDPALGTNPSGSNARGSTDGRGIFGALAQAVAA